MPPTIPTFFITSPHYLYSLYVFTKGCKSLYSRFSTTYRFISLITAGSEINSNSTTISGGKIRTGTIESTGYAYTSGNFSTTGTQINLDNGLIRSKNFSISSAGDAFFKGDITGASGTFSGTLQIGGTDLTAANTLNTQANIEAGLGYTPTTAAAAATAANTATKTDGSVGGWAITSTEIQGGSPTGGGDGSYTTTGIRLGSGGYISAKNFYISSAGDAAFKGTLSVNNGSIGGWTIGSNALESNGGQIKLYASDAGAGYAYGWIEMGNGTQLYMKGSSFWADYTGPGGAWTYKEMSMPFGDPSNIYGVSSAYAVRFRTQAAGEGAILALAQSSGNVSLYGNGRVYAGGVNLTSDRRLKDKIKELDSKFGIEFLNIGPQGWVSGSQCNNEPLGNIWHEGWNPPRGPQKCGMIVCEFPSDRKITKFPLAVNS